MVLREVQIFGSKAQNDLSSSHQVEKVGQLGHWDCLEPGRGTEQEWSLSSWE